MTQPEELKKNEPLTWSAGMAAEVWAMFGPLDADGDSAARCPYPTFNHGYIGIRFE